MMLERLGLFHDCFLLSPYHSGWRGPREGSAWSAECSGLLPAGLWKPPGTEVPRPLWTACSCA